MTFNQRSRFKRSGISVAVALATMVGVAQAESVHRLDQVVVTAARRAQTVDETLAPVTIINRQEIERYQAHDCGRDTQSGGTRRADQLKWWAGS